MLEAFVPVAPPLQLLVIVIQPTLLDTLRPDITALEQRLHQNFAQLETLVLVARLLRFRVQLAEYSMAPKQSVAHPAAPDLMSLVNAHARVYFWELAPPKFAVLLAPAD